MHAINKSSHLPQSGWYNSFLQYGIKDCIVFGAIVFSEITCNKASAAATWYLAGSLNKIIKAAGRIFDFASTGWS